MTEQEREAMAREVVASLQESGAQMWVTFPTIGGKSVTFDALSKGAVYTWNRTERGEQWCWPIPFAEEIINTPGRSVYRYDLAHMGINKYTILPLYPDIDHAYAMTTDIEKPGIVAVIKSDEKGAHLRPIDGWHRVYKCVMVGRPYFLAYALSQRESESICFTLPIEQGEEK